MAGDLEGKVFLVTGATEGIGKAATLEFAQRGATLVLVARNRDKAEHLLAELKSSTGNDRISYLLGDLSSLADMRSIASQFRATHDRLDVLVNNAGGMFLSRKTSADGFEMTFALNHLAYFVLTHELMDLLRKTPGARVVSTSSAAHGSGRLDFANVAKAERFSSWRAYGDSKLANILFTRELARRLAPSGATANCFHPGYVRSGFGLNNTGIVRPFMKALAAVFGRTPAKGAETLVWLATSPEAARYNGEYFFDKKIGRSSRMARNDELAKELWTFTEKLCAIANE